MNRFGPIRQNGYVVRNLDAAMRYWIDVLGVGPFFVLPETSFAQCRYRGEESRPILAIAIANMGDLQIELIEQVNDVPSMYTDFLRDHGPGMQHIGCWTSNFDADSGRYRIDRPPPIVEGALSHGPRFMFFDGAPHAGGAVEILEALPGVIERAETVRQASIGWDGANPIRSIARTG